MQQIKSALFDLILFRLLLYKMSLQPLANPQSRFASLPTSMSWRKNPTDNLPVWSSQIQYYVNDVVLSPLDSGAYVMSGAGATLADSETVVRGGDDPAIDYTAGNWRSLGAAGVGWNNWDQFAPTFAALIPAGPVVAATNGVATEAPDSTWLVTFQGTQTRPLVFAATDLLTLTFTPSGVGATPVSVLVPTPPVGAAASQPFSVSAVVTLPPALTTLTITVSGTTAGQNNTITGALWTLVRLG